ncbi:ATP-dependent protease [Sesbania bispinosa]|nr:ATP-dependent protease [Sesbania bispinosa]
MIKHVKERELLCTSRGHHNAAVNGGPSRGELLLAAVFPRTAPPLRAVAVSHRLLRPAATEAVATCKSLLGRLPSWPLPPPVACPHFFPITRKP